MGPPSGFSPPMGAVSRPRPCLLYWLVASVLALLWLLPIQALAAALFPETSLPIDTPSAIASTDFNGDGHTNRAIAAFGKLPLAYGESGMFRGIFITLFNTAGAMLVISKAQ